MNPPQIDYESLTNPPDPKVEFPEQFHLARKERRLSIFITLVVILALSSPLWVFLIFKVLEHIAGY
jgi:hypothetical protein